MYKIIIIFSLCATTATLKRIDNINKFRFVGTFNNMGLSSSGIEYPSFNNGVTSKRARLTRTKRSPLMYLVPVNEEYENMDNEMTERSRPSRKIKRCKTALCKAGNIPLSGKYGDGMVQATGGESNEEPYGRSTRWKQIRTAKNSVVSKLFKKETDSSENDEDNDVLAESLGENLANERNYENNPSNRRYREKSGKFVCYCQKEDCPDCRSSDSRKELVGAPRITDKTLARDKFKKDRYRKLLRPNDYTIPKIPLVRLPELYREIPYDLRRNHGNANKMDILPIVRGIPPNVHPLTVPFRVAYDPTDTYLGTSGPISQQYQQKLNNIYQHVPLRQYTVASKSKSDIPRRPSASMSKNNIVGSRNNDFTTIASRFKENGNDKDVDLEKSIEDDMFDSNMKECIKLFGRKVCVLAASTNCDNFNKVKNQKDSNSIMRSNNNNNIGSTRNYYETSSAEQSSTYHGVNEDYYDATESYMVSNESPYNIVNDEKDSFVPIDDHRLSKEQLLGNYHDDYYDSTIADVSSDTPEYVTSDDHILGDEYYDLGTPDYVTVDSTEAAILNEASNQMEDTTTLLTDTNSNNNLQYNNIYNIEYNILNPENKTLKCNDVDDFSSSTVNIGNETSTETILDMALTTGNESSTYGSENNNYYNDLLDDFSSSTIKNADESSSDMTLTSENESPMYNSYNDFTSTIAEIGDETSTDTILGDHRNNHYTEETHSGLDYSDIQVVTNGYFTSKGYDVSDENYFTDLDPSAYDNHLPNDGSINDVENSLSSDTKLQATHIPEIIKEQSNLIGVAPTRSYFDLAKSRFFTDSSMNDNFNIDKTTMKDATDLLNKVSTNCEGQERKMDDQGKEPALQYGKIDPAIFITTKSESESQEATTEPSLSYTISSLDFTTNNTPTSDRSTSVETVTSIGSTESGEIITIDDYTAHEAILTTTDKNSVELLTPEDTIDNKETTTSVTKVYDKNVNPIVGFPDDSFSESTDSMMNEENFSKVYDTTSNLITVNDNELGRSEENVDVLNNSSTESTTEHLPFCDNTVLINSIRTVINNFTMDSASLEDPHVSSNIANEELAPEILEIPNLRSFLSLPQIENVIVKNVKNHLLKFAGLPKNSLEGPRPNDIIRNTLRNIFGVLPNTQPQLPPNTVVEHQFRNNEWTTNLVTLIPSVEPAEEMKNQNSLQKVHEHLKNLIFNPAVGLQAAKQNAVQNIIVQAVKHQMENANDVAIEEDTIRDMVGSVLEESSIMDTTKRIEDENNYDEATTFEGKTLEDFYNNFEQVTEDLVSINNSNENEPTTDSDINLYTEDFAGNVQISSTEINDVNNNANNSPDLNKEKSINCLSQVHSGQVTIDLPVKNNSINIKPTTASFTKDFVGNVQLSSTEIIKSTDDFNANQSLDQKQLVDKANRVNSELVTISMPVTNNIIDVETTTALFPGWSSIQINEETNLADNQNLGEEHTSYINSEQATTIVPVATNIINMESTTISEFPSTEINNKDTETSDSPKLGNEQPDCSSNVDSVQAAITVPVTTAANIESTTISEFSSTEINNKDTETSDSPKLGNEQPDCSSNVDSVQAAITVPVTTAANIESTTISEFSSTEINNKDTETSDSPKLGNEQPDDCSNYTQNNNSFTTNTYTENLQEKHQTESINISETTTDITNINEETTLGVPYRDQQQFSETTKNKGETNESKVLRLLQNSFVGAGNNGIGESSSANQGRSSQGKEKCRLCKMESCTSTHEIVTKVHKRVKTTTKKYYGAKENVASEENPIVSSKHQEEDRNSIVSLESQEHVSQSNNDSDDISTTCENLSDENLRDSESDEDLIYKEKISKKKTNGDDKDDLSDLQNSELYYIGDNVKLPLEITKLKDGSYALSISKSICENVLKRKCPCCVPLNGNVRSVKRSPAINGNTDRVTGTRKSAKIRSKIPRKRLRRSTIIDKKSNMDNLIFKNELETLTMPVTTFAKKYNLRLNLDDAKLEHTTPDQLKYMNKIDRDNVGSKKRLIERFNEITRDKNEFEEKNNIYRDKDDQIENIDTNNPVFQRMKFVNSMQQNPELYRRQRAVEGTPNNGTEIIKNVLNWLRKLILY